MIALATATSAPTTPAVGIFWRVNGVLVVDLSTLDEAEPYGDCITHATGHYECWVHWQRTVGSADFRDRLKVRLGGSTMRRPGGTGGVAC